MSFHHQPDEDLPEERRRAIYLALVDAEDLQEFPAPQARQLVSRRFNISEDRVRDIEMEGRERLWHAGE